MDFVPTGNSFTHLLFAAYRAILSETTFGSIADPLRRPSIAAKGRSDFELSSRL